MDSDPKPAHVVARVSPLAKTTTTTTTTMMTTKTPPPPPARCRRRRRPTRPPAKGSLHDILRQHAGTSLFVRPICWTDQHARLLGVRFHELPPCDRPVPRFAPGSPPSKGHLNPSPSVVKLSDALTRILHTSSPRGMPVHACAIDAIMRILWPASFTKTLMFPELNLFFGDRVYREAVRAQTMWFGPSDSPKPMACYISKSQLAAMRLNIFRTVLGPNRSFNEPVYRLQQARSRILMPSNTDNDVQIVAILLAMAQAHFYPSLPTSARRDSPWHWGPTKPSRPQFRDLKLRVISHDIETSEFLVYTGHVTAKFLERFHEPLKAPHRNEGDEQQVPGLLIEYTRVPIWPILGLKERVGLALGHDLVGPFDPKQMEQWDDDEDEVQPSTGGKRKREALSEVFNTSFDETTDDERAPASAKPVKNVKKRRLGESSVIGLVAS